MIRRGFLAPFLLSLLVGAPATAEVKRIVVIKLDGVPQEVLERELKRKDPQTGMSTLPWIDRVFAQNGTRLENFYVRAISLSTPSWSMLDSGRHLEIRGNAEFDRYTMHVYDYLNFFPFYVGYAMSKKVDMPGVEVLDEQGIPLLIDCFPYQSVYQSLQLFQRGVRWRTLQHTLKGRFTSRSLRELLDEWTIGFEMGSAIEEQVERELIEKLADPRIRYLDYFRGDYDHVAHSTADPASQRLVLQHIDRLVGRLWTAIEASPEAGETALVMVSDHGMNTEAGVYSQGYDLVDWFNSRAAGAHHVVTNRHPLTEYKLKGLDPFVSEVVTPSSESLYLKGQSGQYPTALLDLDGNERASVSLRNSDWNALQILLLELNRSGIEPALRKAAVAGFFQILGRHRAEWKTIEAELREEIGALHRQIAAQRVRVENQPRKWSAADRNAGLDKAARRLAVQVEAWREEERGYSEYADALAKLLAITPAELAARRFAPEDLIPKHVMGDANTVYDLENYVVGPSPAGLVLAADGSLDLDRSFERIDYFPLLTSLSVRNNVQKNVASHPVDFIAMRIPARSLAQSLTPEDATTEDAVWLYSGNTQQILILSRHDASGNLELRYLPVRALRQDSTGAIRFEPAQLAPGFPLRLWEDDALMVPEGERAAWLNSWHTEIDWLRAIHRTQYSNGLIALHEQFLRREPRQDLSGDQALLDRLNVRKRRLAEPDLLTFANDHWNFNVRGFNPGGNHGSLRRISMRSVLMLAGGLETGIPRNLVVEEPYDSLSFAPTVLEIMGLKKEAAPLPGRLIREVLSQPIRTAP